MVQETPKFPKITPEQIELWADNPVTEVLLQCLGWFKADVADDAADGTIVDSSSSDLTHAMIHKNLGQQQGLSTAMDFQSLFDRYGMILLPEPKEDDDVED